MAEIGLTMYDTIRDYLNELFAHPNGTEMEYRSSFEIFFKKSVPPHLAKRSITLRQNIYEKSKVFSYFSSFFELYLNYHAFFSDIEARCYEVAYNSRK